MIKKLAVLFTVAYVATALIGCDPNKAPDAKAALEGGTTVSSSGTVMLDDQQPSSDPIKEAPEDGDEVAVMETEEGRIVLMFYPEVAPDHVEHFKRLIREGFYDGTRFHRVMKNYMIQGGDAKTKSMDLAESWGTGDYVDDKGRRVQIVAEFNDVKHVRGVLSMARSGSDFDTASSQFFILHGDVPAWDGLYTAFGRVVDGMDAVDAIATDSPPKDDNGTVFSNRAKVVSKVTIETWPLND